MAGLPYSKNKMVFIPAGVGTRKEDIVSNLLDFLRDCYEPNKEDKSPWVKDLLENAYKDQKKWKKVESFSYDQLSTGFCQKYVDIVYELQTEDMNEEERNRAEKDWLAEWWESRNQFATRLYLFLTETLPNLK